MENEFNMTQAQNVPGFSSGSNSEKQKISRCEAVIAWITLLLGFVFTHFAVRYAGGIWGGIFWFSYGIVGAVYVKAKKLNISRSQLVLFMIAEAFSLSPFFCANQFINFLSAVFVFLMFLYLMITISGADVLGKHFITDAMLSVFIRPFMSIANVFVCMIQKS